MKKIITLIEILLFVSLSFSFSYLIRDSLYTDNYDNGNKKNNIVLLKLYSKLTNLIIDDKNIVSAESSEVGVYTCLKGKNGEICQEFSVLNEDDVNQCNQLCEEECIPSARKDISQCQIGTCYDPQEGICQTGSPKQACEDDNGEWKDDLFGNVPECKKGCCVLGDQAMLASERQCGKQSELLGLERNFKPEINSEVECLALAKTQEEGACVFEFEFEKTCKFLTKSQCLSINGGFYSGLLCSNRELETNCEQQKTARCVEGKDELYWFDSCGNRENIYDSNKVRSYDDGKVLAKNESCSLDDFKNQKSCGNCDYLLGSICGGKTSSEKLSDNTIDYVCRDLRCRDKEGNIRDNGESWCEYQGAIGVDEKNNRAIDTPGSRHFRQVCLDGEIRTESCGDYRNEICIEEKTKVPGGDFSSAACRINRWQVCLDYNTEVSGEEQERAGTEKIRDEKCSKDPDCFVKKVNIDDYFSFNFCTPRYNPGFNLKENSDAAEAICGFASQKCTAYYVKKISGWKCVENCHCEDREFTEKMNNLCISLGDCGTEVSYTGEITKNHRVYGAEDLSSSYLSGIRKYSEIVRGQYARAPNISEFYGVVGIPTGLGSIEEDEEDKGFLGGIFDAGIIPGLAGGALIIAAKYGLSIPYVTGSYTFTEGSSSEIFAVYNPGLNGIGGALAGAGIGLSVTHLLIKITGIGGGLDPALTYALLAAGTYAGAVIGFDAAGGVSSSSLVSVTAAWVIAIVVIAIIVILKILGVGDTKEEIVEFKCNPWQPPLGGSKCEECGKDGLPCSKYSCNSLGQTCEFINEGTGNELCIDSNPNDVSAPIITPDKNALTDGYKYENINENGFEIKSNEGCVKAYSSFSFGIKLNEAGQCKYDTKHTNKFEEMQFDFGSNLFLENHSMNIIAPSLESLGVSGVDPNRRGELDFYIRCQDANGNKNEREYNINICIKPGDDLTPPVITGKIPESEMLKYDATSQFLTIFTNEPSECKWDDEDRDYNQMKNEFKCENRIKQQELLGWRCFDTIPIEKNESKFYIRCLDKPWEKDESKRNANTESYIINYKRSSSELRIDSIAPNNETISSGVEPVSVEVVVKTSGGVDGTATCYYKIGNQYIRFLDTFERVHKQFFQSLTAGNKELGIKCEDSAGNTAEKTAKFNIDIDTKAPEVTRVYNSGGNLVVITNENSECALMTSENSKSFNLCNFDFNNENIREMSGNELIHTTLFEDKTYYVKCKDNFGNAPGECSIIARRGLTNNA